MQQQEIVRLRHKLAETNQRAEVEAAWVKAMRSSTSWRVTAPLRGAMGAMKALRGHPQAVGEIEVQASAEPVPTEIPSFPEILAPPPPRRRPLGELKRSVHQFHSGTAVGDAITNAMFLTRDRLRQLGYHSEIYAEHLDPDLGDELRPVAELPSHADYVLIVRHSMGYGAYEHVRALPAAKVLIYHNITPADLLAPNLAPAARLGRAQLSGWVGHVAAALADSEFNAIELRTLGFEEARACALLFDLDAIMARVRGALEPGTRFPAKPCHAVKPWQQKSRAALPERHDATFTILFVGRVASAKGQDELIAAFAHFRKLYAAPTRLVLVGRTAEDDPYFRSVQSRIEF